MVDTNKPTVSSGNTFKGGYRMNFYKLLDIETGEEFYVNPNFINFYMYTHDGVLIDTVSARIEVNKADFENMMFKEGAKEW